MAKQIRAKFENLVRASPLPKVAVTTCSVSAFCCNLQPVVASPLSFRLACRHVCRWLSSWSVQGAFSRLMGMAESAETLAGRHHGMQGRHQQASNQHWAQHSLASLQTQLMDTVLLLQVGQQMMRKSLVSACTPRAAVRNLRGCLVMADMLYF